MPNHHVDIFYTGNKIDRDDREIPTEVGDEFSQRHSMYFLETSAKSSDNVERLFTEIAQDLLQVNFESNHSHYWRNSLLMLKRLRIIIFYRYDSLWVQL